jgi:hypothetical protein
MKKIILILALLNITSVFAQDLENYTKLMNSDIDANKVNIITFNMMFTEKESEIFWPIYKDYDAEVRKLGDVRIAMIKNYAENYLNMTDEKAEQIMDHAFEFWEERLELKKELWETLKDKISPVKAAKFIQLENQIQRLNDLKINSKLPLFEKTAIDK